MTLQIDWPFIGTLEGQSILEAYVPDSGHSGVTLATGVDLGQLAHGALARMGLPADFCALLEPYVGLKLQAAAALLDECPLVITQAQSDMLDQAARQPDIDGLVTRYGWAGGDFAALPPAAQTVMASVAFQYGPNLPLRTPRFWAKCVAQDWAAVVLELRAFGDAYPTRRKKEADYLAGALGTATG